VGTLSGRVWKFGDDVRLTYFLSGKYDAIGQKPEQTSKHVLEDADPAFVQNVRKGDLIVAGKRFGQGKHYHYPIHALAYLGIAGFIAESLDSMFQRACINDGMPAFALRDLPSVVATGDLIEVDLRRGTSKNATRDIIVNHPPVSTLLLAIVEAGGLQAYTLQQLRGSD
jgi:3-isopropylmalate/(R)-2-methylmalate dehydratase small subunit